MDDIDRQKRSEASRKWERLRSFHVHYFTLYCLVFTYYITIEYGKVK